MIPVLQVHPREQTKHVNYVIVNTIQWQRVTNAVANVNKFSATELIEESNFKSHNFDKKFVNVMDAVKGKPRRKCYNGLIFCAASAGAKLANKELFQHF